MQKKNKNFNNKQNTTLFQTMQFKIGQFFKSYYYRIFLLFYLYSCRKGKTETLKNHTCQMAKTKMASQFNVAVVFTQLKSMQTHKMNTIFSPL